MDITVCDFCYFVVLSSQKILIYDKPVAFKIDHFHNNLLRYDFDVFCQILRYVSD